jgi:hypothetical protein
MTFYGTFGFNQSLRNCYVKIEAESDSGAHNQMYSHYGTMYAFLYPAERFEDAIARHNLTEVQLGTVNKREYD